METPFETVKTVTNLVMVKTVTNHKTCLLQIGPNGVVNVSHFLSLSFLFIFTRQNTCVGHRILFIWQFVKVGLLDIKENMQFVGKYIETMNTYAYNIQLDTTTNMFFCDSDFFWRTNASIKNINCDMCFIFMTYL